MAEDGFNRENARVDGGNGWFSGKGYSSAERFDEGCKGFVLIERGKLQGMNVVLTEKVIPAEEASR